jgi:hypothetical protein
VGITKGLQLQNNDNDETSEESDTNSHFAQRYCIRLFSYLCALGGAEKNRDSIRKYTLFILSAQHCTALGRFRLKNSRKQCTDIIRMERLIAAE